MKKTKIWSVLVSAALLIAVFAVMPISGGAVNYIAVNGGTTNFDKYLVMDEGANVPNVSFQYTVEAGTAQTFDAVHKTIAVNAGPTPEKIKFSGVGISDSDTADQQFKIDFTSGDSATEKINKSASDNVKGLDDGEKYAKKTATLDFSEVSFDEPGIYRYIITEDNAAQQGITYDTDLTRVLDVYVENDSSMELVVSKYILHANADTISIDNTTYGSDGKVITGSDSDSKSQGFTNEYTSHDLTFSKAVSGNQASKDKYFEFTVNISNAVAGTVYTVSYADDGNANTLDGNADKTFTDKPNSATTVITGALTQPDTMIVPVGETEVTQKFYLQHGQHIVIRGLAEGTKYTITDGKEDYAASYQTDDDKDTTAEKLDVASNHTGVEKDIKVDFTNTRAGAIPTGVILAVAAPVTVGVIVLAAIILLVIKNKRRETEEE